MCFCREGVSSSTCPIEATCHSSTAVLVRGGGLLSMPFAGGNDIGKNDHGTIVDSIHGFSIAHNSSSGESSCDR